MGIEYSWVICALECSPEHEGLANVVSAIHWRRRGENANGVATDISGTQELDYDAAHPFTPYENLTPAQVIAWVEANMTPEEILALDAILAAQIADRAAPTVVTPVLPWE